MSFFPNISQEKKQKYLIFIFFILLFITSVLLWEFFKKPKTIPSLEVAPIQYQEPQIDLKILEDPLLKMLRPFETIPPFPKAPGRENPFLPF